MPRIRIDWEDSEVVTSLYHRLNEVNLTDHERTVLEKIFKRYVDADAQRQHQLTSNTTPTFVPEYDSCGF